MIKVLWFSLTPSLGEVYLNEVPTGGGWVKSLEKVLQDKVDLSVAFYSDKAIVPFKIGKSTYFPILKYRYGILSKLYRRIFNLLEPKKDLKQYLDIINIVKPDIIHIHGTEGPFGLIQSHVNIPVVVSVQGNITVYYHKYYNGLSYTNVLFHSKFKSWIFMRTFNMKYRYFKKQSKREKQIFSISKNLIGRTSWDRRITSVLAPNANYFHNDEILRDGFYKAKWEYKKRNFINLITTNGPNLYKGIETLLQCADILEKHNLDFKWKVVGLSSTDEIVQIARKGLKISLSPRIIFLGSLNEEMIIEHLKESDIYISVSHIENSPNSLCEAQTLGMPCIATNAGGTSSLLDDQKDGLLIQDGDPFVMAGAIIELIKNPELAIALGKNSRKRALIRHDPNRISDELLRIYNGLI